MSAHFSEPRENISQLGLREGMKVGDFGAGSGHYARAAAAVVGDSGKVYAIDIQEDVLKHLKLNTHATFGRRIEPVWGDIDRLGGTHLKDRSLDAVILANVLFQVADKKALFTELKRVLKLGGKIMVVDWAGAYGGMGPDAEHVIHEHDAEDAFIAEGFLKVKDFRGGPHHYGLVFSLPT